MARVLIDKNFVDMFIERIAIEECPALEMYETCDNYEARDNLFITDKEFYEGCRECYRKYYKYEIENNEVES
jgi:hypothetical protein